MPKDSQSPGTGQPGVTAEEAWRYLRETARLLRESSREMKQDLEETRRLLREESHKTERHRREIDERVEQERHEMDKRIERHRREIDGRVEQEKRETERHRREIDKRLEQEKRETEQHRREIDKRAEQERREVQKRMDRLETLFTGQWGKLVESLVEGRLVELLRRRGIEVTRTSERLKATLNGKQYEFDIIADNGEEAVVVEVKTTLGPTDVKEFMGALSEFRQVFPNYDKRKVYGAVAYLREEGEARRFAERSRLFVIRATGDSAYITNVADFKPRAW